MLSISRISFTSGTEKKPKVSPEKKEEIREGVVAGGAAGAGYTAAKNNAMKVVKEAEAMSKTGKTASNASKAMNAVNKAGKLAGKTEKAAKGNGLFAGLKNNAKVLTQRFVSKLESIKASKFIKPLINNRITRYACGILGGFFAACILISGVGTLYKNTAKIIDEYGPTYANTVNTLVDMTNKDKK